MAPQQLKIMAIVLLVGAGVFVFAAIERYNENANNVAAMKSLMQGSPLAGAFGTASARPAVPASTKYCALGALICAAAGLVVLSRSNRKDEAPPAPQ